MRKMLAAIAALTLITAVGGAAQAAPTEVQPIKRSTVTASRVVETYTYGPDADQTIDVTYDPSHADGRAVVGYHGGSGVAGSKANLAKAATTLADAGFVVFNVEYRKTSSYANNPGVHWAQQKADALAALDWARANAAQFGADPARFATYGFSWGGLLAATVGLEGNGSAKVNAIVSASGVLQPHRVADVAMSQDGVGHGGDMPSDANRTLYVWEGVAMECPRLDWTDCNGRWTDFLPETHISSDDPPVMMFQGTADPAVPPATATAFGYWLSQKGVANSVTECVNWTHTEACAFDAGWRQQKLIDFLKAKTA